MYLTLFLGFSTLAMTGALLLLVFKDMSPRRAFYKVVRRLTGKDLEPPSPLMEGTYARVEGEAVPTHRPLLLNLSTYDGSGQCVHPDVVFLAQGFGARRSRYWMAMTPYPYAQDRFENPSVYESDDGLNWHASGNNPVVSPPRTAGDHLSDTDMVFVEGKLRLYYRESVYSQTPEQHRLYVTESADGVRWSEPRLVLSSDQLLLSPSVREARDGRGFVMWEVSADVIWRRESADGFTWGERTATSLSGLRPGQVPWHLDVTRAGDELHVLLNSVGIDGHRLHYGHSDDEGYSWHVRPYLIERAYGFERAQHYRATMVPHPERAGVHQMWYSARSIGMVWSIAYLQLVERDGDLVPLATSPGIPPF